MSERPERADWLVTARVAGETAVYDPVKDALHLLDVSATSVWELLDGRRTTPQVVSLLADRYGAHASVRTDVPALIDNLRAAGLLAVAGFPGPERTVDAHLAGSPGPRKPATPNATHGRHAFAALDYAFTVRADDAELEAHVVGVLRDLAVTSATVEPVAYRLRSVDGNVAIEADGGRVVAPVTPDRVPHMLLWHVNQEAVWRSIDRHVILHAAVAEHDGKAVILPAAMERGKTTTVAGLVRAGHAYLSDELAVIELETLRIVPYPKPLGIDAGSQHVLSDLKPPSAQANGGAWQVPASTIRPHAVGRHAQPTVIVAPDYRADAKTAIEPISPARMVIHLADCTFGFRDHPRRDLQVLARLAETCACYRLAIGDLDEAVQLIDTAVTRSSPGSTSVPGT